MRRFCRFGIIAVAVFALTLAVAGSAFASVHVTTVTAISPTLSASLMSTGDAGWNHGNQDWATSPILPVPPADFGGWFNQDVTFNGLVLADTEDDDADITLAASWWQLSHDGTTWGANMPFTGAAAVSGEGLYSIVATGFDADDPSDTVTGTLQPVLGIDKTKPTSWTDLPAVPAGDPDAIPVLSGNTAMVTISATDTLSGVDNLQYSADGAPMDYAWDADAGGMFTVPVTFTPGFHMLSWRVFDNAGNVDSHSVIFIVRPAAFTPNVGLMVRQSGSRGRTVMFSGEVDAISMQAPVKLTIQRWNGKKYGSFMAVSKTMPKFFDDYAVTIKFSSAGRFRVTATFAGGTSKTRTFTTR